jgi:hypothetical protein
MLKKFTAPERHHLFFVLSGFMLLSTVASTQVVVNPDGSETLGTLPMGNLPPPAASQASITVDFNDLKPGEVVSPDRYKTLAKGLRIEIGPSSTTSGVVEGSLTEVPCDGTRSIKTEPFVGPSFLLRFPDGATSVSLDAGDIGPSDSDSITVKAFSDDALETLVAFDIGLILQGAPTGCVRLSVHADRIQAVEITSESFYVLSSNSASGVSSYPNSIFMDNVTFEPVPQTVP